MEVFKIEGGHKLNGSIDVQGAKNEALQIISAVLLTSQKVTIHNIPDIEDIRKLIELLEGMGVKTQKLSNNDYEFQADDINFEYLNSPDFNKKATAIRGSVLMLGPLLGRFKKGSIPKPGGDKIGRRKLDTHLIGLEMLGGKFFYDEENKKYQVTTNGLKGCYILLDEASVTGTANLIMAASLAEGVTQIYNAACEPYIQQLAKMLNSMGANIQGAGTNLITISGVNSLGGCTHTCLPDMIEIGSFIGMAAMTQSELTIKNCAPDHLGLIPSVFTKLGINLQIKGEDIYIPAQEMYEIDTNIDGSMLTIADAPWPGFTPDLISIALVTAVQAKGSVLIHQKMFESRLFFVDNLIDMGAQIILCDPHRAAVTGLARKHKLRGITMRSPDIRAGVALLIAALSAKGISTIQNITQIDRGYERIDERLRSLGAKIERIKLSSDN